MRGQVAKVGKRQTASDMAHVKRRMARGWRLGMGVALGRARRKGVAKTAKEKEPEKNVKA